MAHTAGEKNIMAHPTGTLFNGLTAKVGRFVAKGATCMDDAMAECAYWCGACYAALSYELNSDAASEVYQMGQRYYDLSDDLYIFSRMAQHYYDLSDSIYIPEEF